MYVCELIILTEHTGNGDNIIGVGLEPINNCYVDGTQAGTPEDQSFLPNGQQDSSTHFRTQNGIIAHPEGDDSMEVG